MSLASRRYRSGFCIECSLSSGDPRERIYPALPLPLHCLYHDRVPMKRSRSTSSAYLQSLWTSFLLAGLLFSSSVTYGARNPAGQTDGESGPTSIRSATCLFRNYALTTLPGQSTAGETSKQNRVKHLITHGGLAPRESGEPATTLHQLLVTTDRSVLYLSFRLSRPGGRAPPASA